MKIVLLAWLVIAAVLPKAGASAADFPLAHDEEIRDIVSIPHSRLIATASSDGLIKIWDLETSRCSFSLRSGQGRPRKLSVSADGSFLAAACWKGIEIWDLTSKKTISTLPEGEINELFFIGKGRLGAWRYGKIWVWTVPDARLVEKRQDWELNRGMLVPR